MIQEDWNTVIAAIIGHLPDSISKRCAVLDALQAVVPSKHPARAKVVELYQALISHELAQREFHLGDERRES